MKKSSTIAGNKAIGWYVVRPIVFALHNSLASPPNLEFENIAVRYTDTINESTSSLSAYRMLSDRIVISKSHNARPREV